MLKVWITMLTPAYTGMIVAELVKEGFSVSSLESKLVRGEGPALLSLYLDEPDLPQGTGPSVTNTEFYIEFVEQALTNKGVMFHSVVVVDDDGDYASVTGPDIERITPPTKPLRLIHNGEHNEKQDA